MGYGSGYTGGGGGGGGGSTSGFAPHRELLGELIEPGNFAQGAAFPFLLNGETWATLSASTEYDYFECVTEHKAGASTWFGTGKSELPSGTTFDQNRTLHWISSNTSGTNNINIRPLDATGSNIQVYSDGAWSDIRIRLYGYRAQQINQVDSEEIHRSKLTASDIALIPSVGTQLQFSAIEYDVGGMADVAANKIVVKNDGFYSISSRIFVMQGGRNSQIFIHVNGSPVARHISAAGAGDQAFGYSPSVSTNQQLSAGDEITVHYWTSSSNTIDGSMTHLTVEQLPSSTVAMPETLIPTPIGAMDQLAQADEAVVFENIEVRMSDGLAQAEIRYNDGAGGTLPITNSTALYLKASAGTGTFAARNITLDQNWTTVWADLALNQLIQGDKEELHFTANGEDYFVEVIVGPAYTNNRITVKKKNQLTVISDVDAPVNDQAASGYIDIGAVRMQWGTGTAGGGGGALIALHAPFADANYNVNTEWLGGFTAGAVRAITSAPETTTQFRARGFNGNTAAAVPMSWRAIGLKP